MGQTHSPNPLGNDLFRWITSSGLEILNDPASPTLLHHSTGSRSSPDILLAPASLAPHCEWRTLHGLGSDHLPIEIVLPFFPVRQPNTRPPKFNYKKTSWDIYQSYIAEHLPSLDFDALNIHQAAPLLFPILSRSCQGLYPLWPPWSFPPKPGGPRKRNLQFGNDGGPAPWHTDLSRTASDT